MGRIGPVTWQEEIEGRVAELEARLSCNRESSCSVCNCGDCKHLKIGGTVSNGYGTCLCGHNIRESIVKSNQGTLECDDYKPNI